MNQSIPVCTPEQIQILKTQQFTDTQPGTLVKDFNTLLDFIGENGVVVSEKTQFLAMGVLAELNQRLSNPLDVKLKRPVQKSYPHINALYLLLRSSGLAHLDGDGKKAKLMLNKNLLAQWQKLNTTEQYFFLLQILYYQANGEIIGEGLGIFGEPLTSFFECMRFIKKELKEGFYDTKNTRYNIDHLRYTGFHNIALLDLFGFITIRFDKNNEESWPISTIHLTEFGRAMLSYFLQGEWILQVEFYPGFMPNEKAKSRWENELRKLIPDWKDRLVEENNKAIATQTEGCYIFKVNLEKSSCKLAVPSNLSLDELASGILDAFDFDNDHLYEFIFKNKYGIEERIAHPYVDSDHEFATNECSVGYLPLYKGMIITFWFDFGDDWKFKIQVAEMPSPELHFDDLTVIEKKGIPPKQYPDWDEDDE